MPYKRKRSPYYYVRRRRLPGYGDTGRLSSQVTSKKIARDMERLLEDLAQRALLDTTWYELLDAVCRAKTITLAQLLRAKNTGTMEALKRGLHDPLVSEAVGAFEKAQRPGQSLRLGLSMLRHYTPSSARLGDLSARKITELCMRAEQDGRKRNSVRRTLLRAISLLLRRRLGGAERDRLFAEVYFPAVDDTREVHLSPAEIARLLTACAELADEHGLLYKELALVVRLALQTSADRGVLLKGRHNGKAKRGLLVRDVRIYQEQGRYSGTLHLHDTKTEHRSRSVPLTDALSRALLAQCRHKSPDEAVFAMTYPMLDRRWTHVRERAGLTHIRFKDLRAQISIYGEEAGIPLTVLSRSMGHQDEAMTRRYQQRSAVLSEAQAEAIERAMLGGGAPEAVRQSA